MQSEPGVSSYAKKLPKINVLYQKGERYILKRHSLAKVTTI